MTRALAALAKEVERAAGPSRELWIKAFMACTPAPHEYAELQRLSGQFAALIDAGAWLDAALTLLGPDDFWSVASTGSALVAIKDGEAIESRANKSTLALVGAILRARAAQTEGE